MQIIKVAHNDYIGISIFVQVSDFLQEQQKALAKTAKRVYNISKDIGYVRQSAAKVGICRIVLYSSVL